MRVIVRSGIVASAMVALLPSAKAADMPVKAPILIAPYDWTGFYAGVNAGYSVARDSSRYTNVNLPFPGLLNDETYKISPHGFVGGAQLGYNWQFSRWLAGLEADFQGTSQQDTTCVFQCTLDGLVSGTTVQKLRWFGTVRGRLGAVVDRSLFYVTGGLAYGKVETSVTELNGPPANVASDTSVRTGWTAGAGIEAALAGNWTGRVEYLYIDLGSQTLFPPTPFLPGSAVSVEMRDHVIRAGLNYRFSPVAEVPTRVSAKGPVWTKAPLSAAYGWSGFYLGINAGYGLARDPTTFFNNTVFENESFKIMPGGFVGGGQLGVNWQFGRLVAGVETDLQGTDMRDTACVFGCLSTNIFTLSTTITEKLSWFGTTRARLGYTAYGALFYVTGGVAYGKVQTDVTHIQGRSILLTATASDTKTEGVFGGGVEAAFGGNWSAKVEYLHMNLGSQTLQLVAAGGFPTTVVSTDFRNNIFRAGLNYRFGGPVYAAY